MGEVRRPWYTVKVVDSSTGDVRVERRQSAVWWIRYRRNGKRHEESSGSTKKGDAERLLKLREGDVARGVPVTAKLGRLTFDEAAADVVTDYRINGKRSLNVVEKRIALHLLPYFGGRRMSAISDGDVRAYIAHRLARKAKPATVNRELAILKRAYRLAKVPHRPDITMLPEDNARAGFFERAEFDDVRGLLPEYLRGVVTFAYFTGWRVPSEILTLQWSQVDRAAKSVTLLPGTTKNRKPRLLLYSQLPDLVDVIEAAWTEHQRLAKTGTLCPHVFQRNGQPIRGFRKAWATACTKAGVPGKIAHDFRRTAVRNLVRAGVPDTVAMKITGHKTRSVFDRYNITSERDLREALGALASDAAGKEKGKSGDGGRVVDFATR